MTGAEIVTIACCVIWAAERVFSWFHKTKLTKKIESMQSDPPPPLSDLK